MATREWTLFPYADDAYRYDARRLKKAWERLHAGDREPFPKDDAGLAAWRSYHAGEFHEAVRAGRSRSGSALRAAIKAQVVYGSYLEKNAATKLALFDEAAQWAEAARAKEPGIANAHYLHAFALGRYGQGLSVAKALAQGLGGKVRDALARALETDDRHAEAHIALGAYQAEVIDKVGALVGGMTYGAKKDAAVEHFEKALALIPHSAIARVEYANGLIRLYGKSRLADAERLYRQAAECEPMDAMERFDVEAAKAELS
jgi:hypothetical protein